MNLAILPCLKVLVNNKESNMPCGTKKKGGKKPPKKY